MHAAWWQLDRETACKPTSGCRLSMMALGRRLGKHVRDDGSRVGFKVEMGGGLSCD